MRTSIQRDAVGQPLLVCAVSDQGIGIDYDNLRNIFDPFHQVDGTSTRQYGGNGIGLALSKQLARYMGGDIAVSSTLGEGSTFSLRLPLERRARSRAESNAPRQGPLAHLGLGQEHVFTEQKQAIKTNPR